MCKKYNFNLVPFCLFYVLKKINNNLIVLLKRVVFSDHILWVDNECGKYTF